MYLRREGMFGPITVRDTPVSRELLINNQRQGSVFLEPSAAVVDPKYSEDDPGPVSESGYTLGWLHAGAMHRNGSGLMIGLGSGAGVVQTLYCFPGIDLTVVEIDPVMVEVALEAYPLLQEYADQGRLNIVVEDANTYLRSRYDVWDFGCADAYIGTNEAVIDYFPIFCDRSDYLYVNCIDHLGGSNMHRTMDVMLEKKKPAVDVFKATPPGYFDRANYNTRSNWILTSEEPNWAILHDFIPFADLRGRSVRAAQIGWDEYLTSSLSILAKSEL